MLGQPDSSDLRQEIIRNSGECCEAYGEASAGVTLDSLLDGESEIAVGGGRDLSRHVVGHGLMIPRPVLPLAGYPQ